MAVDRKIIEQHPGGILIVMSALAVSTIALVGLIVDRALSEQPWAPLGPFPEQLVIDDDLVIPLSQGFVTVEGTKCYDGPVNVAGEFRWQSVDPPGAIVAPRSGSARNRDGCLTTRFENPIPDEVVDLVEQGVTVWRLTGFEIPNDPETGREGVLLNWETQAFTLTLEEPPNE